MFIDFLEKQDKNDFTPAKTSSLPAGKLKAVKTELKKTGAGFIPSKLLLAAAALQVEKKTTPLAGKELKKLIQKSLKYMFYEAIIFLVVLIPFMLISFLFSRGFTASIKLLTYLLGFMFVYFLDTAIFAPTFNLIIQAETCREKI
jgi:lipopolysaccharide export LptBFGC system permease protein LptF